MTLKIALVLLGLNALVQVTYTQMSESKMMWEAFVNANSDLLNMKYTSMLSEMQKQARMKDLQMWKETVLAKFMNDSGTSFEPSDERALLDQIMTFIDKHDFNSICQKNGSSNFIADVPLDNIEMSNEAPANNVDCLLKSTRASGTDIRGSLIRTIKTPTPKLCQQACQEEAECSYILYFSKEHYQTYKHTTCRLLKQAGVPKGNLPGHVSGPKYCLTADSSAGSMGDLKKIVNNGVAGLVSKTCSDVQQMKSVQSPASILKSNLNTRSFSSNNDAEMEEFCTLGEAKIQDYVLTMIETLKGALTYELAETPYSALIETFVQDMQSPESMQLLVQNFEADIIVLCAQYSTKGDLMNNAIEDSNLEPEVGNMEPNPEEASNFASSEPDRETHGTIEPESKQEDIPIPDLRDYYDSDETDMKEASEKHSVSEAEMEANSESKTEAEAHSEGHSEGKEAYLEGQEVSSEVGTEAEDHSEGKSDNEAQSVSEEETDAHSNGEQNTKPFLENEAGAKAQKEGEAETENYLEGEAETETYSEGEAETEAHSENGAEKIAQSENGAETEAHSESESEMQAHSEADAETEVHSEGEAETEAHSESEAETEAHSEGEAETEARSEGEAETEAHSVGDRDTEAHSEGDRDTEAYSRSESELVTHSEKELVSASETEYENHSTRSHKERSPSRICV